MNFMTHQKCNSLRAVQPRGNLNNYIVLLLTIWQRQFWSSKIFLMKTRFYI